MPRANPGRFDCHDAALDDEPRFTLLARDPLAGFLVSIWSSMRFGDCEAAQVKFRTMMESVGPAYAVAPDVEKGGEAIEVAMAMFAWREANDGRWRREKATPPARDSEFAAARLEARAAELRTFEGRYDAEWHKDDADMVASELERQALLIRGRDA